jgi:hypothetical protein
MPAKLENTESKKMDFEVLQANNDAARGDRHCSSFRFSFFSFSTAAKAEDAGV